MTNRFGISTVLFEDGKLSDDHLHLIRESGFELVEILGVEGHFDSEDCRQVDSARKSLEKHGLRLNSLHSSINLLDGRFGKMTTDKIIGEMDVLAELGGEFLVIHPCQLANQGDPFSPEGRKLPTHASWVRDILNGGEAAAAIRDRLAALVQSADKKGVKVVVENCDMNSLEFALSIAKSQTEIDFVTEQDEKIHTLGFVEKWMNFLDQEDISEVGLCFDTGHANLLDAPGMLRIMGRRVVTTHVQDNHGLLDEHLVPFYGSIDWEQLIGIFKEVDYSGPFIFEVGLRLTGVHSDDKHHRMEAVSSCRARLLPLVANLE